MYLMTPRVVKCSAHNYIDFFGLNQKSLSLKIAEIWSILKIHIVTVTFQGHPNSKVMGQMKDNMDVPIYE